MACFMKLFKAQKSFDLPVFDSVPGTISKRNSETVSPQLSKSENRLFLKKNGAIATKKNGIASLESIDPITPKIEEIRQSKAYNKALRTPQDVLLASLAETELPSEYYDADEYPRESELRYHDQIDRYKSDSGIEADDIDEAHLRSVSFSENVRVLGGKTTKLEQIRDDSSQNGHAGPTEQRNTASIDTVDTTKTLSIPRQIRRKEGVIADSIDQKSACDFDLDLKFYEKSPETEELIKAAIMANDFLSNMMDGDRLQAVVNAMIPQVFKANNFVIKEGDTGNQFYVSAEGEYEVIKESGCIKSFGAGVVFGELAILYKARRFASIKVTTDAFVWALDRKVFQKIMMKTGSQEREQNIKFLSSVKVLSGVPVDVLHKVSDLLKREFYATGSTIIRQGDQGDKFYIIRGGSVTVTKRSNAGEVRIVGMLKRGEYFGEQALINQAQRLASVIANEPGTECLTLDRSAFTKYLGTIEELKQMPIDQIPREEGIVIQSKPHVINEEYKHVQLSDLEIIGTLGVGGFGRVELVQFDKKNTFALKILKKSEVASQGQIEHAYSEKDIMSSCDSSFIVKLYRTYRNRKYLYFLMEVCLGGDVWTQLQKTKFFDEKTAKFVTACVVEAFEYLHTRGIIYRDLKPENLMIDAEGYVKLVDFGFAKRVGVNTKTWTFAGTPEYVAPEIILNKGHDRAVDYWALGVFIHELLVGKPPFRGKDHMKTYNLILRGIDVVQMSHKIPKSAQYLIKGLCRQTPTERLGYQKNGVADIKKHAWFDGFAWDKLTERSMNAPLKRPIKNNIDLSNFDEYPRERDEPPDEITGWDVYF